MYLYKAAINFDLYYVSVPCCSCLIRYEGRIVQQMIRNDGGKGDYIESTPPMLGIWNTLLKVGQTTRDLTS